MYTYLLSLYLYYQDSFLKLFILCEWMLSLHECTCTTCLPIVHRGQTKAWGPLELELSMWGMVTNYCLGAQNWTWVSSTRATITLDSCVVSLALLKFMIILYDPPPRVREMYMYTIYKCFSKHILVVNISLNAKMFIPLNPKTIPHKMGYFPDLVSRWGKRFD